LGYHDKPVGLLNAAGYYDNLLVFLRSTVNQGFMGNWQMDLLRVGNAVETLLPELVQAAGLTANRVNLSQI
jgi:predicted Rossmann-fold nucleotide-binding protein